MKQMFFKRVSHRGEAILYLIAVAVVFLAHPSMLAAHSTKDLPRELQQQVPYMQLTDRAAPGFVLEDAARLLRS